MLLEKLYVTSNLTEQIYNPIPPATRCLLGGLKLVLTLVAPPATAYTSCIPTLRYSNAGSVSFNFIFPFPQR